MSESKYIRVPDDIAPFVVALHARIEALEAALRVCTMIVEEECYLDREPQCDFERAIAGTGQAILARLQEIARAALDQDVEQ